MSYAFLKKKDLISILHLFETPGINEYVVLLSSAMKIIIVFKLKIILSIYYY